MDNSNAEPLAEAKAEVEAQVKAEVEEKVKTESIAAAVGMLRGMNIPKEQILEQLVKIYNLTEEEAKSYLDK